MTGLSCLTFVLVAFCCYAMSMSKPARNEASKKVEQTQDQQQQQQQRHQHQLQSEATYETRRKRSQLDIGNGNAVANIGDYKDFNEFIEELGDNAIMPLAQDIDFENMPPLIYFMLLQKLKQIQNNERQLPTRRTPRLGRSIDFQLYDGGAVASNGHDFDGSSSSLNMANDYAVSRQFLPRVMKKSVQFKPRLGKRTQVCD